MMLAYQNAIFSLIDLNLMMWYNYQASNVNIYVCCCYLAQCYDGNLVPKIQFHVQI